MTTQCPYCSSTNSQTKQSSKKVNFLTGAIAGFVTGAITGFSSGKDTSSSVTNAIFGGIIGAISVGIASLQIDTEDEQNQCVYECLDCGDTYSMNPRYA